MPLIGNHPAISCPNILRPALLGFAVLACLSLLLPPAGPATVQAQDIPSCPHRADLNQDGQVDTQDIYLIAGQWGNNPPSDPRYDLDGNNRVDIVDVMLVASAWGETGSVLRLPGDGQVWAEGSTRKIGREQTAPARTWVWDGCGVHIKAGRNETEPFQLVVVGGALDLTGVSVAVSDLISLTKNAGPASIGPDQITLYRETYMAVPEPSDPYGYGLPAGELGAGLYPDALVPFEDPYNPGITVGSPFDVPAGLNQPVWIDVAIPTDTLPGLYQGTITVTANQGSLALPLELTVWNFSLPDQPSLSIDFTLDPFWTLPAQYDVSPSDIAAIHALTDRTYQALVDHRLGPMDFYLTPQVTEPDGQVQLDWTQVDPLYSQWLDGHGLPAFYIPDVYDADNDRYHIHDSSGAAYTQAEFDDPLFVSKAEQFYTQTRDHLVSQGWWSRALTYPSDETEWVADEPSHNGPPGYQRLQSWAQLLKNVDPSYRVMASDVFPIPPGPPDRNWPNLIGLVDDWNIVVQDADLDPGLWASRLALGETLSFYHNDWGDFIDYRATLHRGLGWVAFKHGAWAVTGWAVAAWIGDENTMDVVNPWTSTVVPVFGYGGGALFWPGHRIEDDPGLDVAGPLPSIRLKLAREAVEDHDYLSLLAAQTSPAYVQALVTGLIPADYWSWNPAPEAIYALRDHVGELLDAGNPLPLAAVQGLVTEAGSAQPLAGVLVSDGEAAARTNANGRYALTVAVPASETAELSFTADRYQATTHTISITAGSQITQNATLTRMPETALILFSFETADEVGEWEFDNTLDIQRVTAHATDGSRSLRVVFNDDTALAQADRWPVAGVGTFPSSDWSGYTALEFDLFNESDYYTALDVYLADSRGGEYPQSGGTITLLPNRSYHVVIPTAAIAASGVDLTRIAWLELAVETISEAVNYQDETNLWPLGTRTLYLDNLRLVALAGRFEQPPM